LFINHVSSFNIRLLVFACQAFEIWQSQYLSGISKIQAKSIHFVNILLIILINSN